MCILEASKLLHSTQTLEVMYKYYEVFFSNYFSIILPFACGFHVVPYRQALYSR
jgi:hypothetical protein